MTLEAQWQALGGTLKQSDVSPPLGPSKSIEEDPEAKARKIKKEVNQLLSRSALSKIRAAFGVMGLPFFQFYRDLAEAAMTGKVSEKFPQGAFREFRQRARMLARTKLSPAAQNQVMAVLDEVKPWLRSIERNPYDRSAWRRIIRNMGPLIPLVAKDKGVYLKEQARGPERWYVFRMMRPKEVHLEKIKDNDPALYEAIQKQKGRLRDIEETIELNLMEEGLDYERRFLMGRAVFVATDPRTGERLVYDWANQGLPFEEYLEKRKRENRAIRRQSRVFPTTRVINQLRTFSDEQLEELEGPVEFASLTDDKAKTSGMTRVLPVKTDPNGRKVIVKGRFKGIPLDLMVNQAGRMIEGTAYNYNPHTNRYDRIETKGPGGKLTVRAEREPYITVAERKVKVRGQRTPKRIEKLFLKVPSGKAFTEMRRAMFKLSKIVPSVEFVEKARRSEYYFDPKDFNVVRDALQTFALSDAASKLIREYFEKLARAEKATAKKNLGFYTMEAIGGFKQTVRGPGKGLLTKQKQALAWMEARGNNGVCALGTGVGKCVRGDTRVLTSKGLVKIEDMNPGLTEPDTTQAVEGWSVLVEGEELPVKNFYFGGTRPTIKVKTRRGYEVEGSRIHPLLVRTPDGQESWVETPELVAGDYLCVSRDDAAFPTEDPALWVPGPEDLQQPSKNPDVTFTNGHLALFPVPSQMNPDLARLLGYIVAEGWTNNYKTFTLSQDADKNPRVRADIEKLLFEQLGWEAKPGKEIYVQSRFLRAYLLRMGVEQVVAKDKTVPDVIFRSSKETVKHFIRALVDAEGHVGGEGCSHIEFSSASEQLVSELQVLLLRFGVLSTRRPKQVKGYDHTYWRLTMSGADALRYRDEIGFVSSRKQAAIEDVPSTQNSNLDVVPHMAVPVGALFDALLKATGQNVSSFRKKHGDSFDSTARHVRHGRRNPTYSYLKRMLSIAADYGCNDHPAFKSIAKVVKQGYFYDPVEVLEPSEAVVMDIEVGDERHCFVGNGLVNHNTATSIAMMQKLKRDGLTDKGNGRYLYVCPKALRGNIKKEVWKFLQDDARQDLMSRLDILTYPQFRNAWKRDPNFANDYVALFFDEAQALRGGKNQTSRAALAIRHPRKILLTASPIEKEPMDAYVLSAIANNEDVSPGTQGRKDMLKFQRRFVESIGGRTVGVKQDPLTKQDLQTWVKKNVFYGDKQDVEEFELPKLTRNTVALSMDPEVEAVYRETISQFKNVMRGMVARFRFRGVDPESGRRIPEAREKRIALMFSAKLGPLIRKLNDIANFPERFVPEVAARNPDGSPVTRPDGSVVMVPTQNPKMRESLRIVAQSWMDEAGRSVLFTDDPKFVMSAARMLSEKMPGPYHLAAGSKSIHIFQNGRELPEFMGFDMPFREKKYKLYMDEPANDTYNKNYERAFWQSFVFNEIASPVKNGIVSCALHGQIYQTGQNLQAFSNVIHLDRDTWNSEDMKQRTARAWRQGQQNPVDEYTLDVTYDRSSDALDRTLDEIRKYIQQMDEELFDQIIKESQGVALGEEYYEMPRLQARFFDVDRKTLELALSPYVDNVDAPSRS